MIAESEKGRIRIAQRDITKLAVDAVVNAANSSLLGGGGVDGAIHRAAGPLLKAECRKIDGCPEGEARITKGYDLPARHIIHTVGPVYEDGQHGEPGLLRSCYVESLKLAEAHGLESIAFACISTGVYGYPKDAACAIATEAVGEWLSGHELPRRVIFCCFGPEDARIYADRLGLPIEPAS